MENQKSAGSMETENQKSAGSTADSGSAGGSGKAGKDHVYRLKDWAGRPERLAPGHRMCAGCGATIGVRAVLRALHPQDHAVIGNATGCLEVSSYMYPYTAWEDSYIHNAFENAGATLSGVETAYHALKKRGRLPQQENFKFITFGGDGGTYDIGFQSLSGAMEHRHPALLRNTAVRRHHDHAGWLCIKWKNAKPQRSVCHHCRPSGTLCGADNTDTGL